MKGFEEINPVVIALHFLAAVGIPMFCTNPFILFLSLAGALVYHTVRNGRRGAKIHLWFFLLFLILAIINPLISHNGETVLFILNDNRVTLESVLYGINTAVMIISVLYRFRTFSQIMTSEKLLYVFGSFSPKISLILSMAIRYVPLLRRRAGEVNRAQKAIGLYREDNAVDGIRGALRVFSIMTTWTLENGIITADSMSARGYGTGRRTQFRVFRFKRSDFAVLAISLVMCALCCFAAARGALDFEFYPVLKSAQIGAVSIMGIVSYAALVIMPSAIEMGVRIRWRYLKSKI